MNPHQIVSVEEYKTMRDDKDNVIGRLKDKLEKMWAYATHAPDCISHEWDKESSLWPPCNCGLNDLED